MANSSISYGNAHLCLRGPQASPVPRGAVYTRTLSLLLLMEMVLSGLERLACSDSQR